jgi:hypothetical protein
LAVLSGASLTTEKTYLMGKFARVCCARPTSTTTGVFVWSAPALRTRKRSASTVRRTHGPTWSAAK